MSRRPLRRLCAWPEDAKILQLTFEDATRLRCGPDLLLPVEICRRTGKLIYQRAGDLQPGVRCLAVNRARPTSLRVCDIGHHAHNRLCLMHVTDAIPAAPLFNIEIENFCVGGGVGSTCLLVGACRCGPTPAWKAALRCWARLSAAHGGKRCNRTPARAESRCRTA